MVNCAKCGAELIGSRKFCAACGTPAGDPRSPAASTGQAPIASARPPGPPGSAPGSGPAIQYAPAPTSQVNPFAQTAGPGAKAPASDYGPPPASIPPDLATTTPGMGDPSTTPKVSPLAISNMISQRGAFENAVTAGPEEAAAAAVGLFPVPAQPPSEAAQSSKRSAVPGTQLMPSMANPPSGAASAGAHSAGGPPAPVAKRPDRTQVLGAIPAGSIPRPGAPGPSSVVAPSVPAASGSSPSGVAAPGSGPSLPLAHAQGPAMPLPTPMHHQQPPPQSAFQAQPPAPQQAAPQQPPPGWNAVAQPYAPNPPQPQMPYAGTPYGQQPQPSQAQGLPPQAQPGYVFGYPPGSRVNVTWSNGQRYPGTVQQVSGSQCLVVFPDGQHHWVEMQYVAPA